MTMKRQWTRDELAEHWTLLPEELKLLANKTGATHLGFALLLKAFAYQGRFPRQMHELPGPAIVHLANQVGVPAELYPSYEWSGRTIKYHRVQIREYLGFRKAIVQDGHELVDWLVTQVLRPRLAHSRVTFIVQRFDANGNLIGTTKVREITALNETGDTYTGSGKFEVLDLQGNLVASGLATVRATRIRVEPF
jgi:hypothetical protein